MMNAYK